MSYFAITVLLLVIALLLKATLKVRKPAPLMHETDRQRWEKQMESRMYEAD